MYAEHLWSFFFWNTLSQVVSFILYIRKENGILTGRQSISHKKVEDSIARFSTRLSYCTRTYTRAYCTVLAFGETEIMWNRTSNTFKGAFCVILRPKKVLSCLPFKDFFKNIYRYLIYSTLYTYNCSVGMYYSTS